MNVTTEDGCFLLDVSLDSPSERETLDLENISLPMPNENWRYHWSSSSRFCSSCPKRSLLWPVGNRALCALKQKRWPVRVKPVLHRGWCEFAVLAVAGRLDAREAWQSCWGEAKVNRIMTGPTMEASSIGRRMAGSIPTSSCYRTLASATESECVSAIFWFFCRFQCWII